MCIPEGCIIPIKSALKPECMEAALSGEISFWYNNTMNSMLGEYRPLQLAEGNRLAIKDIIVSFSWLWKSRDDHFKRKVWNEKLYHMLFQQSFMLSKPHGGRLGNGILLRHA